MNGTSGIVTNTMTTIPQAGGEGADPSAVEATSDGSSQAAAPPTADGTPGVASTAEEPVDKHLELAKRFDGLAKRESKARRLEAEHQAKLQSISEKEKALAEKLAELDEALGNPIDWAIRNGRDPVELAKRFPEPETKLEKEVRELKESLKKRDMEAEEIRQRQEAAAREQRHIQAMKAFVGKITPDDCPNLTSMYQAPEVPKLVSELLNRPVPDPDEPRRRISMVDLFRAQHDRDPSDQEIIEVLEYEAQERATRILEQHRARLGQVENGEASAPQDSSQSQSAGPSGISNQHASVTNTGKKRPLSHEDRRRLARQELTAALEAESAARRGE